MRVVAVAALLLLSGCAIVDRLVDAYAAHQAWDHWAHPEQPQESR